MRGRVRETTNEIETEREAVRQNWEKNKTEQHHQVLSAVLYDSVVSMDDQFSPSIEQDDEY